MGISNYAQNALGDVVYVELPSKGGDVEKKGKWYYKSLFNYDYYYTTPLHSTPVIRINRSRGIRKGGEWHLRARRWNHSGSQWKVGGEANVD